MKKMQKNLKLDRRTLMQNEVPVKKTILDRLVATEKAFDEKKLLLFELTISTLPGGSKKRKYYAVEPENVIVQQKAQLLKQDGLMKDMRTDFNKQRTALEKKINIMEGVYKADMENYLSTILFWKRLFLVMCAVSLVIFTLLMIFI